MDSVVEHKADRAVLAVGVRTLRHVRRPSLARVEPYLYLLPALLGVGIWIYRPLVQTVFLSFYQWNLLPSSPKVPVGLSNYQNVLNVPGMQQALQNTAVYIVGLLPFSVIAPLALAILVDGIRGRLRDLYRTALFTPLLMAPIVVSIIWGWLLDPTTGVVNAALHRLTGAAPVDWLNTTSTAIWAIVAITGWKIFGFSMLIFSASLTNLDRTYFEAASVDGAGRFACIRLITLPLMASTILFMVMMSILLSAQWTFPLINSLTGGGPINSTTNLYFLLYQLGFQNFSIGYSAAASLMFFVAFGLLALAFIRLSERFSFHDA
jgi:multiple sugar transport system permease protein